MKGNRAVLAAVVAIVLVLTGWWLFKRGSAGEAVDLLARYDEAVKRPAPDTFQVKDVDLNGEVKKAIAVAPGAGTRLTWKLRVPDDAWVGVSVGLQPEAWKQEGDGVLFRVGVSDGRAYEDLIKQHINPFANQGERKWIPMFVDLSAYAGEEVELIFNTNSSLPGADDQRGDLAVWGAPSIVIR